MNWLCALMELPCVRRQWSILIGNLARGSPPEPWSLILTFHSHSISSRGLNWGSPGHCDRWIPLWNEILAWFLGLLLGRWRCLFVFPSENCQPEGAVTGRLGQKVLICSLDINFVPSTASSCIRRLVHGGGANKGSTGMCLGRTLIGQRVFYLNIMVSLLGFPFSELKKCFREKAVVCWKVNIT